MEMGLVLNLHIVKTFLGQDLFIIWGFLPSSLPASLSIVSLFNSSHPKPLSCFFSSPIFRTFFFCHLFLPSLLLCSLCSLFPLRTGSSLSLFLCTLAIFCGLHSLPSIQLYSLVLDLCPCFSPISCFFHPARPLLPYSQPNGSSLKDSSRDSFREVSFGCVRPLQLLLVNHCSAPVHTRWLF